MTTVEVGLTEELQNDYLRYSLANIARTIPHYHDGLTPVQRRLLWTAYTEGFASNKPFVKSAKLEGTCMASYHPHAGSYGAIVTLANTWNNQVNLLEGHGCFGSSTDGAAAARYTEIKLSPYSERVLLQETETLRTVANYDGSLQEPITLGALLPNLLVIGSTGISVGYATNCLSHNISEVIEATINFVKNGTIPKLLPDFKQGCKIYCGEETKQQYFETGKATFRLRAILVEKKTEKVKRTELTSYTFENLPYGSNPEKIGEQLKNAAETLKYGDLQLKEVIDESDRTGDRLTVISKRDDILDLLYRASDLQTTVSANTTVLNPKNIPQTVNQHELLEMWYENRKQQVISWTENQSQKLESKLHVIEGYIKLLKSKQKAIKLIQEAESYDEATNKLQEQFGLSKEQTAAVLELKLKQITKLNLEEFEKNHKSISEENQKLLEYNHNPKILILKQLQDLAKILKLKRYCEIVSENLDTSLEISTQTTTQTATQTATQVTARKSFYYLDLNRGIISRTHTKDSFICETNDKIIAIAEDGLVYKIPNYKDFKLQDKPVKILWAEKMSKCTDDKIISIIGTDSKGRTVGKSIKTSDLVQSTSKGTWLGLRDGTVIKEVTKQNKKIPIKAKHHKLSVLLT